MAKKRQLILSEIFTEYLVCCQKLSQMLEQLVDKSGAIQEKRTKNIWVQNIGR